MAHYEVVDLIYRSRRAVLQRKNSKVAKSLLDSLEYSLEAVEVADLGVIEDAVGSYLLVCPLYALRRHKGIGGKESGARQSAASMASAVVEGVPRMSFCASRDASMRSSIKAEA